jgi:hypothetical protein
MKKIITICAAILMTASVFAQAPEKMSYQAVVRDGSNNLVSSTSVGMQISLLQGSSSGTAVYVETQTPTSNVNGLVSIEIGSGTVVSGTFNTIDWANGPYFIKTETDPTGGTAYTIAGTNELMSVPYALFSANADVGGFTHYLGEVFNGGIIYYLYKGSDGLEHGLIVAFTESVEAWQTTPTLVNANRTEDGAFNTALMTGSPAATYIAGLGAGWYLPSIDELGLLYYNRYSAQKGLRSNGNTLLNEDLSSSARYWSSTEYGFNYAWFFNFYGGDAGSLTSKGSTYYVRAVRAF